MHSETRPVERHSDIADQNGAMTSNQADPSRPVDRSGRGRSDSILWPAGAAALRKGPGFFDLGRRQTYARPLVSGLSALEMGAAQACSRQQDPPARSDRAFGHVGLAGVHLREFDLSARQALFGSGQQPPDGLRSIAFGSVTAIVQSVFVNDSEIELRVGMASFGSFK